MGGGEFRRKAQRRAIDSFGIFRPVEITVRVGEIAICRSVIWPQSNRFPACCYGLRRAAKIAQEIAEVVVGLGEIGPKPDRGDEAGLSFSLATDIRQQVAEIAVRFGKIRPKRERRAILCLGLLEPTPIL